MEPDSIDSGPYPPGSIQRTSLPGKDDAWLEQMDAAVGPREIERKFLVRTTPPNIRLFPHQRINQGYLVVDGEGGEVRIRKKGERCYLTVKNGSGLVRQEFEISLDESQFGNLWPATAGRRIIKDRFAIPVEQFTIELDFFSGPLEGLVIAEVEFRSIDESSLFNPPDWFSREVTTDERYRNRNLAIHGLPDDQI